MQVWRDAQGNPLGLRWHSEHCENPLPSEHHHIVINDHAVQTVHLDWLKYVRWLPSVKPAETEKPEPKSPKKGFFSKYGLLLMIFVAVALGRGIRQGLIELREEVEREQQEAEQKKKPPGQIRVVVPRKKDSKVRKRARTTQK